MRSSPATGSWWNSALRDESSRGGALKTVTLVVRQDIEDGYVSPEMAATQYGYRFPA
jgi:hypothetical protein